MIFKLYDCDFGFKINGQDYSFEHVNEVKVEDPETTKLVRGANAANKIGLVFREGLKDPKKMTVTILNMTAALKAVLDAAYIAKTRMDAYCVDRIDGSSKFAKNSILSTQPMQLTVNDSNDSMNVELIFETFDLSEDHKS